MGSSPSRPASDQQIFASDHPVRFSESLVNSLQNNSETDSTRAKNIEYIIQARVTAELEKRLAQASNKLESLSDSISQEPVGSTPKQTSGPSLTEKPLLNRLADKLTGNTSSSSSREAQDGDDEQSALDRSRVASDIAEMKRKLGQRKKIAEVDKGVEAAKEKVVKCLRVNDRRPLDCWKEVEAFKLEVQRLERNFVDGHAA